MRWGWAFIGGLCAHGLLAQAPTDSIRLGPDAVLNLLPNHPVFKASELLERESGLIRMKAKGGFDPKLSYDLSTKNFDDKTYYRYEKLGLSVATWPGIDFKAEMKRSEGEYLNPEAFIPGPGNVELGADANLLRGLVFDARRTALAEARIVAQKNEAERLALRNALVREALSRYWNWSAAQARFDLFQQAEANARVRFEAVKRSARSGQSAAIDTVEALGLLENRRMDLAKAELDRETARLLLEAHLWTPDSLPLRIDPATLPIDLLERAPGLMPLDSLQTLLLSLDDRSPELLKTRTEIDKAQVRINQGYNDLLPEARLSYRWISPIDDAFNTETYNPGSNNYLGLGVELPLFLRKERSTLQFYQLERERAEWLLLEKRVAIANKALASRAALETYARNAERAERNFGNYSLLLEAEVRKFSIGESSLFLVNSREISAIQSGAKWIENLELTALKELEMLELIGGLAR